MRKKRKKLWSVTGITHPQYPGITVRVGEWLPGGRLHVFRMVDGKQRSPQIEPLVRRVDLGKEAETEARKIGAAIIAASADKTPASETDLDESDVTLGQLAEKYKLDGFHRTTAHYKRDQVAAVKRFATLIGEDVPVAEVKPSHLAKYMAKRIEEEHGPAGKADLVAFGIACNWAVEEGHLDENPLMSKGARRP